MIIKQQGYNNDMRMESNSSLWTGADAEISIIIIIIITHTKIGAQQKKRSISMTIWTSSRLDFFPSPTMGLRATALTTGPLLP